MMNSCHHNILEQHTIFESCRQKKSLREKEWREETNKNNPIQGKFTKEDNFPKRQMK